MVKPDLQLGRGFHRSFLDPSDETQLNAIDRYLEHEQTLIDGLRGTANKVDLQSAKLKSTAEAAVLLFKHPQLLHTLHFSSLYRYLRTVELTTEFKRGGQTLLVGSGNAVAEIMALYLKAPLGGQVEEFLKRGETPDVTKLTDKYLDDLKVNVKPPQPELLPGTTVAFDPDPGNAKDLAHLNQYFQIPEDKFKFHLIRADQFSTLKHADGSIDTLLWHRAEPTSIPDITPFTASLPRKMRKDAEAKQEKNVDRVMKPMLRSIKREGHIFLTWGEGNSTAEGLQRSHMRNLIEEAMPKWGLQSQQPLPGYLDRGFPEYYLQGLGIVAHLIGKKIR